MKTNFTTKELIEELSQRKGIELLNGGLYTSWELKGKYEKRDVKIPSQYQLILIRNS